MPRRTNKRHAPKPPTKLFETTYSTNNQTLTSDGNFVRMSDGRLFKRTVLPRGSGLSTTNEPIVDRNTEEFDGERAQRLTLLFHGVDLFESSPSFELSPLPQ